MKLKTNLPIYISTPLIFTPVSLFLFTLIPVIGALLFLPLIPLANVYDSVIPGDFSESGVHVEIGFAWIILKTWQAWLFYGSFFFYVGTILGGILYVIKNMHQHLLINVEFCIG